MPIVYWLIINIYCRRRKKSRTTSTCVSFNRRCSDKYNLFTDFLFNILVFKLMSRLLLLWHTYLWYSWQFIIWFSLFFAPQNFWCGALYSLVYKRAPSPATITPLHPQASSANRSGLQLYWWLKWDGWTCPDERYRSRKTLQAYFFRFVEITLKQKRKWRPYMVCCMMKISTILSCFTIWNDFCSALRKIQLWYSILFSFI